MKPDEIEDINRLTVLTVKQAARVANVATGTLYRRWKEGTGPEFFKIGKCRRIKRSSLDSWMSKLTKAASKEPPLNPYK